MRIQFLYLYFFWSSFAYAEEFSGNFLLEHYSLQKESFGLGSEKKNADNQKLFAWINLGKRAFPSLDFLFLIKGIKYRKKIENYIPKTNELYAVRYENGSSLNFSTGLKYKYLSFYSEFNLLKPSFIGCSIGLQIFPEKNLFFHYRKNKKEQLQNLGISIVSGISPAIGLSISKEFSNERNDWSGSISFSFQFDSYQAGISHLPKNTESTNENSFFLSKILKENLNPLFEKEINPYEGDIDLEKEKNRLLWEAKKFTKKERIVHEIRIDELLKFKIPLVLAIRIARASKSKEEYTELLKKLPPNIVKKCNKIQYDKAKN